jgi:hypothetical protein
MSVFEWAIWPIATATANSNLKESPGMKTEARIIIELRAEQWHAWFADVPDFSRTAATPGDAMTALLCLFTQIEFSHRHVTLDERNSREGHFEFLVPFQFLHSTMKTA